MDETQLAAIAGDLNAAPAIAASTPQLASLVCDMNCIVRETADAFLDLDSTTASFEAFKAERGRPA